MPSPSAFRSVLACLVLSGLIACGTAKTADNRPSSFTSLKPGTSFGQAAGGKSAAAEDSTSGGSVKVEDSDVVRWVGDKFYILNQFRGLQVVDVSNPQKPALLGHVTAQGTPREMYVADGLATVLLSEHDTFTATAPGQLTSTVGSLVQVIDLAEPAKPQISASVEIPGWVVASRRINNRLIVVSADVGTTPWWGWCWGPYACMADASGGKSTADVGSGSATSTGGAASMWWPWGGYGYGAWAQSGRVTVIDQQNPKDPKVLGSVQFDGGVAMALIQPGEVMVVGSQWQSDATTTSRIDRLQQVTIGQDGALKLAAKDQKTLTGNDVWYGGWRSATALGSGEIAIAASTYQPGETAQVGVELRHRKIQDGAWMDVGTWQAAAPQGWWDVRYDAKTALVTAGGWESKTGTPVPTTLHVVDLTAAPTQTANLTVPDNTQPVLAVPLSQTQPGLWLLSGVTYPGDGSNTTHLRTLSLADLKAPVWLDSVDLQGGYAWWGAGTEVLESAGLILAAQQAGDGKTLTGLRIVTVDKTGVLKPRGTFGSNLTSWWQLRSLAQGTQLWRVGNQAMEVVDIANLDAPKPVATLELAAHVSALASVSGRVVALVADWQTGTAELRTLQQGAQDEQHVDAKLTVPEAWGRLYVAGNIVWFIGGQAVRAYDYTDPLQPKARGTWQNTGGNNLWYNLYDATPHGNALWLTGQQSTVVYGDSDACTNPSTDGSSEPGKPGTDSTPEPAIDADSKTDSDILTVDADSKTDLDAQAIDAGSKTDYDAGTPEQKCIVSWSYTTRIVALNLANPDQPVLAGAVEIPGASWAWGSRIVGDTLWLTHYESAAGSDGQWYGQYFLDRVNIADPAAPTVATKVNVPGWVTGISPDGQHIYALDWQPKAGTQPQDGQIQSVLDVLTLDGDAAYLDSQTILPASAGTVLLNGTALYIAAWPYAVADATQPQPELLVLDVAQADAPKLVQTLHPGAPIGQLGLHGQKLIATIGWGAGVQVWNVSDPLAPQYLTFAAVQGQAYDMLELAGALWLPMGWCGVEVLVL